jgi:hypothetical protein
MTGARADLPCEDVRELAPELALGLLTGEERAEALAHLEGCDGCRAEVASLAVAADEVLLAAPAVEPPPGFADRVLDRIAAGRATGDGLPTVSGPPVRAVPDTGRSEPAHAAPRPRRRRFRVAVAAAAAALVVVVAGVVAVVGPDWAGDPPREVVAADMVTGRGRIVGTATAVGTNDGATAEITVDVPEWSAVLDRWGGAPAGSYWLVIEHADGTRTMRALAPDVAEWSMEVRAPVDDIAAVSMVDDEGRVWCTGAFGPT